MRLSFIHFVSRSLAVLMLSLIMIGVHAPAVSAGPSQPRASSSSFYQPSRKIIRTKDVVKYEKIPFNHLVARLDFNKYFQYIELCGNAIATPSEQCDKWDKHGAGCGSFGFIGQLGCTSECRFDFSNCHTIDPYGAATLVLADNICGNWIIDSGETCDNRNLPAPSSTVCTSSGYYGGHATCNSACNGYDFSSCVGAPGDPYGTPTAPTYVPACNNGYLDIGEQCDGATTPESGGQHMAIPDVCPSQGFYGGLTQCNADCTTNTDLCYGVTGDPYGGSQHCGDGVVNSSDGEECDGGLLPCTLLGYYSGTAQCAKDCQWKLSSCSGWGSDPYGSPPSP